MERKACGKAPLFLSLLDENEPLFSGRSGPSSTKPQGIEPCPRHPPAALVATRAHSNRHILCRVPLLISHPQSPFQGQHYRLPVELLDIYPTVLDLLGARSPPASKLYKGFRSLRPEGKSLAPLILGYPAYASLFPERVRKGEVLPDQPGNWSTDKGTHGQHKMPSMRNQMAIIQVLKCSPSPPQPQTQSSGKKKGAGGTAGTAGGGEQTSAQWQDCDLRRGEGPGQGKEAGLALMGYALRTPDFKYVEYFRFNRSSWRVLLGPEPFAPGLQELYDHRDEQLRDFTHRETVNLVRRPAFAEEVKRLRQQLINFLNSTVAFRDRPWPLP